MFINHNGDIVLATDNLLSFANNSFKYGDGCFETMRVVNGKIQLRDLHFERLFSSLDVLGFNRNDNITHQHLEQQVKHLLNENQHEKLARVRLTIYRQNGELFNINNNKAGFIIESWPLTTVDNFEAGVTCKIYFDARKSFDQFSAIKSNNYLTYLMSARFATAHNADEAIILNPAGNVVETTIANLFIVHNGVVKTPAITEGPINGVMRRYILKQLLEAGMPVTETTVTVDDLLTASEVFLTNAVRGIRWVKQIEKSNYTNQLATHLHQQFILPLFKS